MEKTHECFSKRQHLFRLFLSFRFIKSEAHSTALHNHYKLSIIQLWAIYYLTGIDRSCILTLGQSKTEEIGLAH